MLENSNLTKMRIILYSLPIVLAFGISAILAFTPYTDHTWVQIPLHSAIEAAGAVLALVLSVLLLSSKSQYPQDLSTMILSSALIGMGVLDLFHAFNTPGQAFVWLHSTAALWGGVLFALVWISPKLVPNSLKIPIFFFMLGFCFALWAIVWPEKIPIMLQADHFTLTAKRLNVIGGLGFFSGSIWFFKNYYHAKDQRYLLFANLCLLFGVSAAIFGSSKIWNVQWWIWHAMRLLAYSVALFVILIIFKTIEKQKDALLEKLQEALGNIKVLKGLLPICSFCKKIRDDEGYWRQIESYLKDHSEAEFSHGICPECAKKNYPAIHKNKK